MPNTLDSLFSKLYRIVHPHPQILSLFLCISLIAIYLDVYDGFQVGNDVTEEPDSLTVVGYRSCGYFMLAKTILAQVPTLKSSPLEMADKTEFKRWLEAAHDAQHVPIAHDSSPTVFLKRSSELRYLGGLDTLWVFLQTEHGWNPPQQIEERKEYLKKHGELPTSSIQRSPKEKTTAIQVPSLRPQLNFGKRVATKFRTSQRYLANYKPLMEYFRGYRKGWVTGYNMPLRKASVIVVGDQTSAMNAANTNRAALINNIGWGGQGCFGGTKGGQLQCRMELAEGNGCAYDSLGIQPAQFRLWNLDECEDFFSRACSVDPGRLWIEKPTAGQHGFGMKVHQGCEDLKKVYGKCEQSGAAQDAPRKAIAMVYLDPALIDGHKFDVRTYLVVASLDPAIVLYHDGFVRKAKNKYGSGIKNKNAHITNAQGQTVENADHFWDFEKLGRYLAQSVGFPENYFENYFREHAMKVTNFVFQASRSKMFKRPGTFQIFALDWIIDSKGYIHLLEANSNPLVTSYPIAGYPETWNSLMDIVLDIHGSPERLGSLTVGLKGDHGESVGAGSNGKRFQKGGWRLVFNELEEKAVGATYNSCDEFSQDNNIFKDLRVTPERVRTASDALKVLQVENANESEEKESENEIDDFVKEDDASLGLDAEEN